jgi:hypothetical protein
MLLLLLLGFTSASTAFKASIRYVWNSARDGELEIGARATLVVLCKGGALEQNNLHTSNVLRIRRGGYVL